MCNATCPVRYFADDNIRSCFSCPYDCYTCNSSGACLSCNETTDYRTLSSSTSRCVALPGYFEIIKPAQRLLQIGAASSAIVVCPNSCATCSQSSVCSFCAANNYLRSDNYCYPTCLPRFFENNVSRRCVPCPYDCLSCLINGQCLSCDSANDFRELSQTTKRCKPIFGYY
jgi:proprotein convertase subtilisin/kexin type 5